MAKLTIVLALFTVVSLIQAIPYRRYSTYQDRGNENSDSNSGTRIYEKSQQGGYGESQNSHSNYGRGQDRRPGRLTYYSTREVQDRQGGYGGSRRPQSNNRWGRIRPGDRIVEPNSVGSTGQNWGQSGSSVGGQSSTSGSGSGQSRPHVRVVEQYISNDEHGGRGFQDPSPGKPQEGNKPRDYVTNFDEPGSSAGSTGYPRDRHQQPGRIGGYRRRTGGYHNKVSGDYGEGPGNNPNQLKNFDEVSAQPRRGGGYRRPITGDYGKDGRNGALRQPGTTDRFKIPLGFIARYNSR